MANPSITKLQLLNLCMNNFLVEFDSLPNSYMDAHFFSKNNDPMHSPAFASDLELGLDFDGNSNLVISFDDLENLYIHFETKDFPLPNGYNHSNGSIMQLG